MDLIDDLKKRLEQKLPAEKAHKLLMNYKRQSAAEILATKKDVKTSAVLCLLFKKEGEWKYYLMERNSYKGVHSAQISFPGGRKEHFDKDYQATALRESQEELNINPNDVEILGELSTMYIPPSNFLVYPFVGVALKDQRIVPDRREVSKVLEASLSDLISDKAIGTSKVSISGGKTEINVKHYTVDEHIVWGATGMILSELAYIIKEIGYGQSDL